MIYLKKIYIMNIKNTQVKIQLLILFFIAFNGNVLLGQTTIFTETIGNTGTGTLTISATTFDNSYTFTGDAGTSTSTPSSSYSGASGNRNVFITSTSGRFFQISGINTTNYTNLALSLGHYKSTTAGNNELVIEVSSDGANYSSLTYSRPTGSGTAVWSLISPTGSIPSTANLRIRFRQTSTTTQFRIDDIKLTGTLATSSPVFTFDDSGISSFGNQDVLTYSTSQSFTVSGANLTNNVVATAPTANYELSLNNSTWGNSVSIVPVSGTITNVPVYVRFYPQTSGTILNDINLSSIGVASSQVVTVVGNGIIPQLPTPVATSATSITATSFVANWNSVSGATNYAVDVSTSPTFTASNGFTSDLIISEYVEGSSNNKYIELFNGTGADVDLSDYEISVYANGATSPSTTSSLSGTLTFGSTVVYQNSGATIYAGATTNLGATNFNGNDVVALVKLGNNIDIVGTIGDTSNFAQDVTLKRMSSIFAPTTTYNSSEWTSSASDDASNLGMHSFDGGLTPSFVPGYENVPVGNTTSYNVTGLTQGTTYYYRVRATGANTSENSNVIQLTTDFTSVIWNGTAWNNVTGPTSSLEAVIEGVYTTATNGVFTAKNVVVNSGSLTINSNTTLTIEDNIVNNLTAAEVVVESNGILKQVNDVANSGNITVRRNSANILRLDYTAWSSPVSGQNLFDFTPETLTNRFYDYSPSANSYIAVSNVVTGASGTNFAAGKGYLLRAPNTWSSTTASAYPGEFKGVPTNGNVTVAVENWPTNPGASNPEGYNLVGNPYPSPISASSFLSNLNNALLGMGKLYFWTHTVAAVGGTYPTNNYASHNGAGGVAAAAGGATPDGIIQVGQGFIVDALSNGTAEFTNSMRLDASNGQFFKNNGGQNQTTTIEKHRIWLGLTSPGFTHNQILIGYIQGATDGLDASFDAKLFGQSNSVLYSTINANKYVIQGRALPFNATDVVPLGLVAQTAGQYTISMNNFDGLFVGQDVFLRDNLLNVTHDIKGTPYTFVSDAGDFASRFEIVYGSPLSVETPTFTENSVVVYNNESGININAGQTVIESVKVFDVRGRLLVSKSKVNASSIVIENVSNTKQVLIVQITSSDNVTVSKKVVN